MISCQAGEVPIVWGMLIMCLSQLRCKCPLFYFTGMNKRMSYPLSAHSECKQENYFLFFYTTSPCTCFLLPFLLLLLSTYIPLNHFLSPSLSECQVFVLLRQPSEGAGGSKLAFGNEPGSAVGGQAAAAAGRPSSRGLGQRGQVTAPPAAHLSPRRSTWIKCWRSRSRRRSNREENRARRKRVDESGQGRQRGAVAFRRWAGGGRTEERGERSREGRPVDVGAGAASAA